MQSIETSLLSGTPIRFPDPNGKSVELRLEQMPSRRLFDYLRKSTVREAKDLPPEFITGLWESYCDKDALEQSYPASPSLVDARQATWRIASLQTKNFGGVNVYGPEEFVWVLDGDSWLLDGENASGKSSLLGALVWAFTGNRPRDESTLAPHLEAPVMDGNDTKIGTWPPLASYPPDARALSASPEVEVIVTLIDEDGKKAVVQRALRAGKVYEYRDPALGFDDVFVSTGCAMPVALSSMRLKDKDGEGALTRAVAQLTGLDALSELGDFAAGLCNGAREYASYAKKAGLAQKLSTFNEQLTKAASELAIVGETLPTFRPQDAIDKSGPMIQLGVRVAQAAASHAGALSADLAVGTDTSRTETQREIIVALANVSNALTKGLEGIPAWKAMNEISQALAPGVKAAVESALITAESQLSEALKTSAMQQKDSRFRIKAAAANWHEQHEAGPIQNCPLCKQSLELLPNLREQLESLRASSAGAQMTLHQNILQIRDTLARSLPKEVAGYLRTRPAEPRAALVESIRQHLGSGSQPGRLLVRMSSLLEEFLADAPAESAPDHAVEDPSYESEEHKSLHDEIRAVKRCLSVAAWHKATEAQWIVWWTVATQNDSSIVKSQESGSKTAVPESMTEHVRRLSAAMDGAKPYSRAVEYLRDAVRLGQEITKVQVEQDHRNNVIEALQPLKQLTGLSQSVARQAIEDLSDRILRILTDMHTSERFRYRGAALIKREGLVVSGSIESEMRIDATLIANTSWLRSTLWAFIFALREEAVEQHGGDPFPVWLFDDPQVTFDLAHRFNWSSYVAGLQKHPPCAQIIVATHDEGFAAKLRLSELNAREALLKAASNDSGPLSVLEGSSVIRHWESANADRSSNKKAVAYLVDARVYLEGMLKAMLAGQGADIKNMAISDLRSRIVELAAQGRAPWDKRHFTELVNILSKPAIAFLHQSHHSERFNLSFAEAKQVSVLWPSLFRVLSQCFHDIRDYRLLHGMPSAFHLAPSAADLPEGFSSVIAQKSLPLLGRASAFSGRVSEGALVYEEFGASGERGVRLGQHSAYRLMANTLEPVAQPGDILLVHDTSVPRSRSLVVAVAEDHFLARRYVISDASSDVAVLTANAMDPSDIAAPIVARKESLKLRRIVGVLFDAKGPSLSAGEHEIHSCTSESEVKAILSRCLGLVEVSGQSAQPLALDGQYLLVGERVNTSMELARLDGRPVIALDSDERRYFKRLRLTSEGLIILESLDGAGEYPPEVLWEPGRGGRRTLNEVWEVLGVLFEKPTD